MLFLYFLKRKFFLYFRKCNPTLFSLRLKNKKKSTPRKFLRLSETETREKLIIYFSKQSCSYVLGNENSETQTLEKLLIFQEVTCKA